MILRNASGTAKHAYPFGISGKQIWQFTINNTPFAISAGTGPRVEISLFTAAGAMIAQRTVFRQGCGECINIIPAFSTASGMCIVRVTDGVSTFIHTGVIR